MSEQDQEREVLARENDEETPEDVEAHRLYKNDEDGGDDVEAHVHKKD